jgi:hypothetical protein
MDYSDVSLLVLLFKSEQIDTVISGLPINGDESAQAQLNLINLENNITVIPGDDNTLLLHIINRRRKTHHCHAWSPKLEAQILCYG